MHAALVLLLALPAGRPLAVLPVTGVNVSLTRLQELSVVDDALRAAATGRDDVSLQGKEQTLAAIAAARSAGVACGVADVACVKKLAVLSEVELVLVPVATPRKDGGFAVVLTLLEVTGPRPPERMGDALPARGRELDVAAKKLVDTIFERWKEPPLADPGPAPAEAAADPVSAASPEPAPAASTTAPAAAGMSDDMRLWIVGGSAGAALLVGAVAGGVAAWLIGTAPPQKAEQGPPPPPAPQPTSGSAVVVVP